MENIKKKTLIAKINKEIKVSKNEKWIARLLRYKEIVKNALSICVNKGYYSTYYIANKFFVVNLTTWSKNKRLYPPIFSPTFNGTNDFKRLFPNLYEN